MEYIIIWLYTYEIIAEFDKGVSTLKLTDGVCNNKKGF